MDRLKAFLSSRRFETVISVLIVVNAITLGLETVPAAMEQFGGLLLILDRAILAVFVVEVLARLLAWRLDFFRDPWRIFDLLVVGVALLPATGNLSVLRALRILRVLRIIGMVPSLKRVVGGLVAALPGMGSIMLLLTLVFYVFSVMATKLYGNTFPEWFGSIPASAYSLFQVMTLESWSMGIVRPVMEVHPMAWAFFIPFIACTTFTVLNLFIGIIVSAMQEEHEAEATADREAMASEQGEMLKELREIRKEIAELRAEQGRQPSA
ncbi:Ion transport protein [Hoeflea phototrophica DFL-43]|uniref:Ion transport protein n=1 Tax=Hoeflea phototrophica (strain DSM 17068 / NCIMB 14078 / DFL-43) TaxID=411684 RepID=A9DFB3_HOEPD|nr:ion transporter [Hoeflea phototrophica]EDQ31742.1 Ion transport protein [Hoeflea phototrophica DFL-43]